MIASIIKSVIIPKNKREKLVRFLEHMIWIVTKRAVLKKLHEMRWYEEPDHTQANFTRRNLGVPSKDVYLHTFFNEMSREITKKWHMNLLLSILGKFNRYYKNYIPNFPAKVKQTLKILQEEKYIREEKDCLTLTGKGEKMISWLYYLKVFFGNTYVKSVVIGILMIFITHFITTRVIKEVSRAIIEIQVKQSGQPFNVVE